MERRSSPWAVGLAIVASLVIALAGYLGIYYWKVSSAGVGYRVVWRTDHYEFEPHFKNDWETLAFKPAVRIHNLIYRTRRPLSAPKAPTR